MLLSVLVKVLVLMFFVILVRCFAGLGKVVLRDDCKHSDENKMDISGQNLGTV